MSYLAPRRASKTVLISLVESTLGAGAPAGGAMGVRPTNSEDIGGRTPEALPQRPVIEPERHEQLELDEILDGLNRRRTCSHLAASRKVRAYHPRTIGTDVLYANRERSARGHLPRA